ncbi:MAG: hypothetical protein AVDCRST_MAG07-2646, partial [uncultured Frankineae bacterium]
EPAGRGGGRLAPLEGPRLPRARPGSRRRPRGSHRGRLRAAVRRARPSPRGPHAGGLPGRGLARGGAVPLPRPRL